MPRSRFGVWGLANSDGWRRQTRPNLPEPTETLRIVQNSNVYMTIKDEDGNRVVKRIKNIKLGEMGRRALIGDETEEGLV